MEHTQNRKQKGDWGRERKRKIRGGECDTQQNQQIRKKRGVKRMGSRNGERKERQTLLTARRDNDVTKQKGAAFPRKRLW